jgi:hypothetical protein
MLFCLSQILILFRPLCPEHYEAMVSYRKEYRPQLGDPTPDIHGRECPVDGCCHNYSPSFGYFTVASNDDYWVGTSSSSVRIAKGSTQVICGEHKDVMFIESFDANAHSQSFRCPQKDCDQTMKLPIDGPPTYWLGVGYFRAF